MLRYIYMNKYKVGTNQYKKRYKTPLTGKIDRVFLLGVFIYAFLLLLNQTRAYATNIATDHWLDSITYVKAPEVSFMVQPAPKLGLIPEKELKPTKANIVAYIMEVFGKYGTDVAVQAIECFYSESGLRTEAYNFNNNGTEDRGVAQINSIHGMNPEDAHDFIKNIDMAEKVYVRAGQTFNPWYGARCN